MATAKDFIEYAAETVARTTGGRYALRHKKMFGEYMLYVNEKPLLLVCDNTVFVKRLPQADGLLTETGAPYSGAKEHYILDIEDAGLTARVIDALEPVTPLPKPKAPKPKAAGDPIGDYIAAQEADVQPLLAALREAIRAAAPDSEERIAWNMPTFWQGENLVHFAANKKHVGIYPGGEAVGAFAGRLAGYKTSKGAIQLPLKRGADGYEPLDYGLVADIVKWRLAKL